LNRYLQHYHITDLQTKETQDYFDIELP